MPVSIYAACLSLLPVLTGQSSDEDAIRALNRSLEGALEAGDVDALVSLLTDDVVMMPPGSAPVEGREAVRARFETTFSRVSLEEIWTEREIVVRGDVAFDWSAYEATVTPRQPGVSGSAVTPATISGQNFFVAVRGPDGGWRYSRLIWNRAEP